jgi:all-trans-retinol dehydrogenase (NAD+)
MLVTGAASGNGRLMALGAAARGAHVIAWDVDPEGLDRLTVEIASSAGPTTAVTTDVVDVTDRRAVYAAAQRVDEALGGIDVLVLNAGVVDARPILEVPDEAVERVMDVNVLALFWCTKAFLPRMVEQQAGHVVTIASIAALCPTPGTAAYGASKHAAYGFADTLRNELRETAPEVHTTVVMPFFINTGMFAGAGRISLPTFNELDQQDVADRVLTAIEADHERVILPSTGVVVYYLRSLPPRVADWIGHRVGLLSTMKTFQGRSVVDRLQATSDAPADQTA